jgi:nicotinamide riboside transporter PnuC
MWIITALSLIGVILNIHKRQECFVIWGITNAAWAVYDYQIKAYEQAALFVVYFILAVYGLYKWARKEKGE